MFVTFDTDFVHTDGVFATLPTLGGGSGYALGINDAGTVVGNAFLANNTTRHAFVYAGGVLTDLTPDIGNRNSSATDINNAGIIVGYRELTSPVDQTGFYYNGSHFVNLKLGGSRSTPTAINSAGWVVGQSSITGNTKQHGFLFNGEAVLIWATLGALKAPPMISTAWAKCWAPPLSRATWSPTPRSTPMALQIIKGQ